MNEENQSGLTAEEQAYFDSEGETPFEPVAPEKEAVKTEAETDIEAETGEEGDKGERDEKGRFVNYGALHQERKRRQELETQVNELAQFKAAMNERMEWFKAAIQPPAEQQKQDDPPDPEVNIFEALKYERQKREALEQQIAEKANTEAKTAEQQRAEAALWDRWHSDARQYKEANPDFDNAAKWMSDYRDKQLQALARVNKDFATPQGRNKQIEAELAAIVVQAAQGNMSSAEAIYEIAKGYGYAPQQAADIAAEAGPIELPEKLKNVAAAQEASRSVGGASGKSAGAAMTIEGLAAMPQAEFNEWIKVGDNEKTFKRLMGG